MIGAYGISKAAVLMMVRVLAKELGPFGIRVNAIAPGLVKTRFSQALWDTPEILDNYVKTAPLGRIGAPEEIAGAAVYLASDASSFMTGQVIVLDGGVLA
jgi:NAD(P)-dependent dehydrogenase (short-subunit alcohol dehydrogenase family)